MVQLTRSALSIYRKASFPTTTTLVYLGIVTLLTIDPVVVQGFFGEFDAFESFEGFEEGVPITVEEYEDKDHFFEVGLDDFDHFIDGHKQALILWHDTDPENKESKRLLDEFDELARMVHDEPKLSSKTLVVFVSIRDEPELCHRFSTEGGGIRYLGWGRTTEREGMVPVPLRRTKEDYFEFLMDHLAEEKLFFRDQGMDRFVYQFIRAQNDHERNQAASEAYKLWKREGHSARRQESLDIYIQTIKEATTSGNYIQKVFQTKFEEIQDLVQSRSLEDHDHWEAEKRLSVMSAFVLEELHKENRVKNHRLEKHLAPKLNRKSPKTEL